MRQFLDLLFKHLQFANAQNEDPDIVDINGLRVLLSMRVQSC